MAPELVSRRCFYYTDVEPTICFAAEVNPPLEMRFLIYCKSLNQFLIKKPASLPWIGMDDLKSRALSSCATLPKHTDIAKEC